MSEINKLKMYKKVIILFIFIISSQMVFARDIIINNNFSSIGIGKNIQYLEDKYDKFKIDDIINKQHHWMYSRNNSVNFGFTTSTYWYKISVDWSKTSMNSIFFEINYPMIDYLILYEIKNKNKIIVKKTGDHLPFRHRDIHDRNFIFYLQKHAERTTYYLKVSTTSSHNFTPVLWSLKGYVARMNYEYPIFWIYYGIMCVMFIYALYLFFSMKLRRYLYYSLFILSYMLFQSTLNGLSFQYLWPNYIWWANNCLPLFITLSPLFLVLFTRWFLDTKTNFPKIDKIILFCIIIPGILISFYSITGNYIISIKFATPYSMISTTSTFIISVYASIKKLRRAYFLAVSVAIIAIGVSLYVIKTFGIIPSNLLTNWSMQLGSSILTILLSFGLFDIVKFDLEDLNLNLEKNVKERTNELSLTLKKLTSAYNELENAKDIAEKANYHKSKFLANMSHELRTPLNSINGIVELLKYGSYEKDDQIIPELKKTINLLEKLSKNNLNKGKITKLSKALKTMEKAIVEDGNVKRYIASTIRKQLKKLNPDNLDKELNENIEKLIELIVSEENEKYNAYSRIKEAGDYLLILIDEILNLSHVELGKIKIKKGNISVKKLVETSFENAKNYARSKDKDSDVILDYSINNDVPETIFADLQRTQQVLLNLFSNAIKFTQEGHVSLSVMKKDNFIRFEVNDTGVGIKEEDKKKIFIEFERTEDSDGIEGTGLGLVISKKFVELQGGTMSFESEHGKGSKFWFELPYQTIE